MLKKKKDKNFERGCIYAGIKKSDIQNSLCKTFDSVCQQNETNFKPGFIQCSNFCF